MALNRPPLTPRQLAVLRWIADGCPDGVWPDHTHKLSVGVLETRNLASVRRWYGKWNAVLQPNGQYYLDHGTYPEPAPITPRVVKPRRATSTVRPAKPTAAKPAPVDRSDPAPARVPAKPPSLSEQLIADILEAGGSLTLQPAGYEERSRLDAQIRAARRSKKLPAGTQLVEHIPSRGKVELKITDLPTWMTTTLIPIPVPAQLRKPHAAVVQLQDTAGPLPVTGGSARKRALRLLQALITAAAQSGHTAAVHGGSTDLYGRAERHPDLLRFKVRGHEIRLQLSQQQDRTDHIPTAKEVAEKEHYSWTSIPKYDYNPSSRLKIEISGMYQHRQSVWTDGARSQLEDKLAEILQEIELRSDATERARLAAAERQRQEAIEQEQRVARAKVRLIEANRAKALDDQVSRWMRAQQLNIYLDAMQAAVEEITDPAEGLAATEWLTWARRHVETSNPLNRKLALPPDPEPTYTALEPFMERPRGRSGWPI